MRKKSSKRLNKNKNKNKKTKKQKPIVMIGCSNKTHCNNCGKKCHCINCKCEKNCYGNCYLNKSLKRQTGGSCGMCGQLGGTNNPNPFVGNAWEPNRLPGENGITGDRNYYKLANVVNNPQQQMKLSDYEMMGGYTYDKNKKSKTSLSTSLNLSKGGGFVPQDLINLGRDVSYNFNTAYNALNGYKPPIDPLPYKGQLTNTVNKFYI